MKEDFVFFWGSDSVFSNWFQPNKFTHNNVEYNCSEQYMMHMKALAFGDHEVAKLIMEQTNPRKQKMLGREVRNFDNAAWMTICQDIMVDGLVSKFTQDTRLKTRLLLTNNKILVEASPTDSIWGIGLAEDNPLAWNEATWQGQNLLGKTLVRVRAQIRDNDFKESLAMGVNAEDIVYHFLIERHRLVQDIRKQTHEDSRGPRLRGTEGEVVLPDFAVYDGSKGKFILDVKGKNSVYRINGVNCFTVDRKYEQYLKIKDVMGVDYLVMVFVFEDRMYFYRDNECCGTYQFTPNQYGDGLVYLFPFDGKKPTY